MILNNTNKEGYILMNMKKWLYTVVAAVITLTSVLTLTACDKKNAENGADKMNETNNTETTENVPLTEFDVLTIKDGRFYLEGKPFAEIGYNKFDLFWQPFEGLYTGGMSSYGYKMDRQEQALKELNEMGVRSIRVFCVPHSSDELNDVFWNENKRENIFFKVLDDMLDLCDKYDIKVVYSLCLTSFRDYSLVNGTWVFGKDHYRELFSDPECDARKRMNEYIEIVVGRYKDRKTVLMWELSNEITNATDISADTKIYDGERMPTLADAAKFYDEAAKKIKEVDPMRLVNSGGGSLRETHWNQYVNDSWGRDTLEEQYMAMELLYKDNAVDIIDIHTYTIGSPGSLIYDEDKNDYYITVKDYMDFSERIGKPMMVGEFGLCPSEEWPDLYYTDYSDLERSVPFMKYTLDMLEEAMPQLTYIWQYSSDRPVDQVPGSFTLKKGREGHDELLEMIMAADKRIKAYYGAE